VDTHDEGGSAPLSARFEVAAQPAGNSAVVNVGQLHPQPGNAALAEQGATNTSGMVSVNSRALVDETLKNWANFSSENLIDLGNIRPMLPIGIDPPDHLKYRKLLDPLFAPKRMDAIEADVAARVNRFIDGFEERGSCNFTTELAEPFPSSVFLGLMGLPWSELETMMRLRDGLLRPAGQDGEARLAFQKATALEVYEFFGAILDERGRDPQDDILTLFLTAEVGGAMLDREEVLDICFLLLIAGLDTVTDSLTCFWAFLAQNPEHRQQIVDDPEVIPRAVEELLRWETPVPSVVRWSRRECTVGDQEIAAGDIVSVNISAANVDENEFPDPLEVRFDREVNRHLSFGGGVHRCLGSHLARRELRVALREWHRRIPNYGLAPGYEVAYNPPLRFVPNLQLAWR
jgi:cytochrome P450